MKRPPLTVRIRFLFAVLIAVLIPPLTMEQLGVSAPSTAVALLGYSVITFTTCVLMAVHGQNHSNTSREEAEGKIPHIPLKKSYGPEGWGPTLDEHTGNRPGAKELKGRHTPATDGVINSGDMDSIKDSRPSDDPSQPISGNRFVNDPMNTGEVHVFPSLDLPGPTHGYHDKNSSPGSKGKRSRRPF